MPDLPVMLNVRGKLAVVVGGGVAARRRIASLIECGARTRVIAPHVDQAIETAGGEVHRRAYREGDLEGACLVVIATDDPQVNDAVQREAIRRGALVNRADDSPEGDIAVMAHRRHGPVTVAVSTGGISAAAAVAIRDELASHLDDRWVTLVETIAPFRAVLRQVRDAARRQEALRRLSDGQAREALRERGAQGLIDHCQRVVQEAGAS